MCGETDIGPPVLMNVQTWSFGSKGFELISQITLQSSTVLIFKEENKLLY